MAGFTFKKAAKAEAKLRLAVFGPSGSGKTYTGLRLAGGLGGNVAVIDTERGSASKYADRFSFDVLELEDRTIDTYVAAIKAAEQGGYNVLIIDSLSHAWQELLTEIDKLAKAKYRGNTWSAWSDGTPKQRLLVDAILGYNGHVIATMRSKTEWATESSDGKNRPVRIGLAPEQGKGIEYEFDMLIELSTEHVANVIKDRTGRFQDRLIDKPSEELGRELAAWLSDGEPEPEPAPMPEAPPETFVYPERPWAPEITKRAIAKKAERAPEATDGNWAGATVGALSDLLAYIPNKDVRDVRRHELMEYLVGKSSTKNVSYAESYALRKWAQESTDDGGYVPNAFAIEEAKAILAAKEVTE